VRQGSTVPALPATINVTGGAAYPQQQQQQQQQGYSDSPYSSYESVPQPAVALPDTLTVTSIIDQPPAQQPCYGMWGQAGGYAAAPAVPLPEPLQWETHYSEGRPYYFCRATGQTQWEPPAQ